MGTKRLSPGANEVSYELEMDSGTLTAHIARPEQISEDDWSEPEITALFAEDSDVDLLPFFNEVHELQGRLKWYLHQLVDVDDLQEAFHHGEG